MNWLPIETEPLDGRQIEVKHANGSTSICPSEPRPELSREQRKQFAKMGEWPDHKNWKITHWRAYG